MSDNRIRLTEKEYEAGTRAILDLYYEGIAKGGSGLNGVVMGDLLDSIIDAINNVRDPQTGTVLYSTVGHDDRVAVKTNTGWLVVYLTSGAHSSVLKNLPNGKWEPLGEVPYGQD